MSKNPGKNWKGQPCRALTHHRGPVGENYVADTKKRRETKCKRLATVKKNLQTLSHKTGIECLLQWKEEAEGPVNSFKTDGCSIQIASPTPTNAPEESLFEVDPEKDSPLTYPDPPHREEDTSSDGDKCAICHNVHIGRRNRCLWINCTERKCEFWAHSLCVGLTGDNEEIKNINYKCPEHIKLHVNKRR